MSVLPRQNEVSTASEAENTPAKQQLDFRAGCSCGETRREQDPDEVIDG